jgi:hypothetical protein
MDFAEIFATGISPIDMFKVALIVVIGILLGIFAKFVIKKIAKISIYPGIRKNSPGSYKGVVSGVELSGSIVMWLIIASFIFQALSIFKISLLNQILERSIDFFPRLIIGLLIFIVGMIIVNIISRQIRDMNFKHNNVIAKITSIILIFAIVLSALEAVGIKATPFIELFKAGIYTLGIIIAITIGIGLGFALRPEINRFVKELKKQDHP